MHTGTTVLRRLDGEEWNYERAAAAAKAVTTIDCWEAAGKERIPVCAVAVKVEL